MPDTESIVAIHQLIALYGHIVDDWDLARLDELFTAEGVFDMSAMGLPAAKGPPAIRSFMEAMRAQRLASNGAESLAHHASNVFVSDGENGLFNVISKGLVVFKGEPQRVVTILYEDVVASTLQGWRFVSRAAKPPAAAR